MSTAGTQPSQPLHTPSSVPATVPVPVTGTTVRGNAEKDPWKLLKADHDAFRDLLSAWRLTSDATAKRKIALELSREIVAHASIEEQWVHQLYKQYLTGPGQGAAGSAGVVAGGAGQPQQQQAALVEGDRFYKESLEADQININALNELEHGTKELVTLWEKKKPEERTLGATANLSTTTNISGYEDTEVQYQVVLKRCEDAMSRLMATEAEHLTAEEKIYFPQLDAKMSQQEKALLYDHLVSSKKIAPTHAHPSRPDNPTIAKIVHPIAGAVDRIRDSITGRQ
jgi:hypothetical protein